MVKSEHNYIYGFEKLEVWKNSITLAQLVYNITANFPKNETYGLTSQIRRAIVSVSSNIAEGSSKNSYKDQARFSEMAYGSLLEVLNQLIISYELEYINEECYIECRNQIEVLSRQLNAYKNSQITRIM